MNRGSSAHHRPAIPNPGRFNEAPIHESGKCLLRAHRRPPSEGFNEAPIHESGKFDRRPPSPPRKGSLQ